ncbi:phosphoribosylformylglycinamidine synthase subunit PurL [Alicyclobacillus sp. SP_1]|uniref:phosphoribosylformylglycinamidine synthase subunit PurL n=1 Tax=Alicyclobacillus sp. SP_1 TaxID=2942475 RepID=UPI002157BE5A|nr:phosphoribosylformylglycinamidine synthase subunit PurL [Alicyclobacillus sp. SP_1]
MRTEPTPEAIEENSLYRAMGLTDDEYRRVVERLGRRPNYVETGLFGVLWSEHCSYKSSRAYLKKFPTSGPQVLQGPGENAGVVDIGDGIGIAFKMESHNHPSAVEPYQGAATGVGGILRDVFTMGARPIAFLNSLRFGPLEDGHTRYLFANVVAGIGGYGNCVGIPTVGGEAVFDPAYTHNPLVNAMCVGMLPADAIATGAAKGVGNPVFVVGSRTGRDGIHGATFASTDNPKEKERSAVQVGDPFLGKLLMEACLELISTGAVVGIQDMGAAGLTSSSAEMASRAGGGVELYLDLVPCRESGMSPYEMMLSESQERMLVVMEKGQESLAFDILHKWDLQVEEIGKVTDDGRLRLLFHGDVVADVPVSLLVDEAPVYQRCVVDRYHQPGLDVSLPVPSSNWEAAWLELLAHPTIADKRWIYQQYDTSVRASTLVGPGSDAALVLVPGTQKAVAMATDGNGRYVYLNPRVGGAIAVAEAARNVVCSGARPLALTNCLNFGNPEKPAIMRQFADAVEGMGEASRALDVPVVSGNVSFYNETGGTDIFPTPVVGVVGVLDALNRATPSSFQGDGHEVVLVGVDERGLDGSLYWQLQAGKPAGDAPYFRIEEEVRVQKLVQAAIAAGYVLAAHDVSEGGLAVALAEMAVGRGVGVQAQLIAGSPAGAFFGEAQGRILLEVADGQLETLQALAAAKEVPCQRIGRTGGAMVSMTVGSTDAMNVAVARLASVYNATLPERMNEPIAP